MDRLRAAAYKGQVWWASRGIATPLLIPTDLGELAFIGISQDQTEEKRPFGFGLTLFLREEPVDWERQARLTIRQEPVPGIHSILAQVPDLLEERIVPLHDTIARLFIGGPHPREHMIFHGDRILPHVPMSRVHWVQNAIAYTIDGWGLAEERILRVATSLRPFDNAVPQTP